MTKLTLAERFLNFEFDSIKKEFDLEIPEYLKEYLREYTGLWICENTYTNKNGKLFSFAQFVNHRMMYDFSLEFKEKNLGKKIPFALDDGGWVFCLSLDIETKNQVLMCQLEIEWENKEDAFEFVADSFEEFIGGLQAEEVND